MERKQASDFDRRILDLFDGYVHGRITRRDFMEQAGRFAVGGMTAGAILESLSANYLNPLVSRGDARIQEEYVMYPSPAGYESVRAYKIRPAGTTGRLPAVVVVHENRGLNPYIEDVARRFATEGFLAFAPDGLTSLGGYPGNDDQGREMQSSLDRARLLEDFVAAVDFMQSHPESTGRVGIVGFCYGGGVSNTLATRNAELGAAVPFYGGQPAAEAAANIRAPLLLHFAEDDEGVNSGWPAWEAALRANGVRYEAHVYPGTLHGFHNDTTPRYNEGAARLAWQRTVDFFRRELA
jgi:carboxymethylenebutenolidase